MGGDRSEGALRSLLVVLPAVLLGAAAAPAGTTYFPGQGEFGTLLFEDQWPCRGDADHNDLVLRFNAEIVTDDGLGGVESLRLTLSPAAAGSLDCVGGLGLRLGVPAATPLSASVAIGGAPPQPLAPDPAESDVVLWIADDLRAELCGGQSGLLNTDESLPPAACSAAVVDVAFAEPAPLPVEDAPFDLFLHRCGDRAIQIHRPEYAGTDQADPALYGTCDDASSPPGGPFYVDTEGVPFAIAVAAKTVWPKESVRVDQAFPLLAAFISSGGSAAQDWYRRADFELVYGVDVLTFDDLAHGEPVFWSGLDSTGSPPLDYAGNPANNLDGTLFHGTDGVRVSGEDPNRAFDLLVAFDTTFGGPTSDPDLIGPPWSGGNAPDAELGRVLVVQQNNLDATPRDGLLDDPDDEEIGPAGVLRFDYDEPMRAFGFDLIDVEDPVSEPGMVVLVGEGGALVTLTWEDLAARDPSLAFGNASVNIVDFIDEDEVATTFTRAEIHLGGEGAVDNVRAIPAPEPTGPLAPALGVLTLAALRARSRCS